MSLASEFEVVRRRFPGSRLESSRAGHTVHIPQFPIPAGWTKSLIEVWFQVPLCYPVWPPSCFWMHQDVMLGPPGACWHPIFALYHQQSPEGIPDGLVKMLWEPRMWRHTDSLRSFTGVILARFYERR